MQSTFRTDDPAMDMRPMGPIGTVVEPGPGTRDKARLILGASYNMAGLTDRQIRIAAVSRALNADASYRSDTYLETALDLSAQAIVDRQHRATNTQVTAPRPPVVPSRIRMDKQPAGVGISAAQARKEYLTRTYGDQTSMSAAEARRLYLARRNP